MIFIIYEFYFAFFSFHQATSQRLISHVVADHSAIDPTYVEDLLLTYRTFLDRPSEICSQLLNWFLERRFRDKVKIFLKRASNAEKKTSRLDFTVGGNDFVVVVPNFI